MGDRLPDRLEFEPFVPPAAGPVVFGELERGLAPRQRLKVSDWADQHRRLSTKGSAKPGQWSTARNEILREPMDSFSIGSGVREVAMMFPIQLGKTEVALNVLGYTMTQRPGPLMVCLPGEVSMNKWVQQKLTPMIDETPVVKRTLTSVASREAANTRTFKDFAGGQLYLEHAGSPSRLKSTSVRLLIVDEVDEFSANFVGGDDPMSMLEGRTSAFPNTSQRLFISSPQIKGMSRIEGKWEASDQRRYFVPCPHCGHRQHLQWSGLRWSAQRHPEHGRRAWYVCSDCGAEIEEHHKAEMLRQGRWIATNPGGVIRGYHANCLYYPIGLGPRWGALADMWLDAQGDPAKEKTFVNDRLAETYEDKTTRNLKHHKIADAAEGYALRTAPAGVLCVTAGVDTQDDRLAVHLTGWGRGMDFWALDYVEFPGDPSGDEVWATLAGFLATPIQHASGASLYVEAFAQDAAGHKTEEVKNFIRSARQRGLRRPLCIFGAVQNNAPVLKKGKTADITYKGKVDKNGIQIWQVGTVAAKNWLFGRLSRDADLDDKHLQALQAEDAAARTEGRATKPIAPPRRMCHFSAELPERYFPGLTSEVFNPVKNRYEKKRGSVRNEPLDTWVYSYAATHHPELRLHRHTELDWARREALLQARAPSVQTSVEGPPPPAVEPARPQPEVEKPTPSVPAAPVDPAQAQSIFAALLRARKGRRGQ